LRDVGYFENQWRIDHFKLGNGGKMMVEGIGSVRVKLHDGVI